MPEKIRDERGGMPSASAMTRIFNCPASYKLNAAETPESSGAAVEGTMLHRHMELTYMPKKTPEQDAELKALGAALNSEQTQSLAFAENEVEKVAHFFDGERHTEQRLWAANMMYSGQADMLVLSPDKKSAVIVDYKFGRGEVEPAERNYQLAALAVLAADNYGVENVRAMIIQPRALDKARRITACEYIESDIEQAREAIDSAVKSALYAKQPREAVGYWCNYCPSAYRCKAAQEEIAKQYALAVSTPTLAIGKHNAVDMFEKASVVKKLCDEILKRVKEWVSANPDHGTALVLTEGARRAKVGNAAQVFEAVESVGITPAEFVGVCDVGLTKLLTLYHDKRKNANEKQTKKASDLEVKQLLADKGLLSYTQNAPTLALEKGER